MFVARKHKILQINVEGKAIPVLAWTGLEGTRSLSLPDFKTVGI
jgi:hypothetical protein